MDSLVGVDLSRLDQRMIAKSEVSDTSYSLTIASGRIAELDPIRVNALPVKSVVVTGDTAWTWNLRDSAQTNGLIRSGVLVPGHRWGFFTGYTITLR